MEMIFPVVCSSFMLEICSYISNLTSEEENDLCKSLDAWDGAGTVGI
jgi:hypothetical protein